MSAVVPVASSAHVSCLQFLKLEPQIPSAAMPSSDVSSALDGSSTTEQSCHSSDSELISDSDHDLQPDSDSVEDVSSNRLCSQSCVEPVG